MSKTLKNHFYRSQQMFTTVAGRSVPKQLSVRSYYVDPFGLAISAYFVCLVFHHFFFPV